MTMQAELVPAAIADLEDLLAGDQVRFHLVGVEAEREHVRLRLDLDAVDCVDCVLPADALAEVVADNLRRSLGTDALTVTIDDPRDEPDPDGPAENGGQ